MISFSVLAFPLASGHISFGGNVGTHPGGSTSATAHCWRTGYRPTPSPGGATHIIAATPNKPGTPHYEQNSMIANTRTHTRACTRTHTRTHTCTCTRTRTRTRTCTCTRVVGSAGVADD